MNPAFPVIDMEPFMLLYNEDSAQLSSTLVCDVYAISITFWNQSSKLKRFPCPDHAFAWNLAVKSLHDDFLGPGSTTLQAALLDLAGRPETSITGNGVNNGRIVALAYSLGLNRDAKDWQISAAEKNLRSRLWWAVLIHDHW